MANLTPDDPQAAKQFLLSCVVNQSHQDGVELSDIKKRMFLFSETSGDPDWEANQRFEAECNDAEYEAKIAKLLHRSYFRAKKCGDDLTDWTTALEALRDEDFYGLVMVDQAKIPRPKPRISTSSKQIAQGFLEMEFTGYNIAKGAIVIAALFLLLDPWHWGLLRSDVAKLLCIAIAAFAVWIVGRIQNRTLVRTL